MLGKSKLGSQRLYRFCHEHQIFGRIEVMDIDQLKLVLDTVSQMGGDAKDFGMWYLAAIAIPKMMSTLTIFTGLMLAVRWVYKAIMYCIHTNNGYTDIASMVCVPIPNCWGSSELKTLRARIQKLVDAEKKET